MKPITEKEQAELWESIKRISSGRYDTRLKARRFLFDISLGYQLINPALILSIGPLRTFNHLWPYAMSDSTHDWDTIDHCLHIHLVFVWFRLNTYLLWRKFPHG